MAKKGESSLTIDDGTMRKFKTGATRDTAHRKLDPYGFISPLALHRFSVYMDKHRVQSDGQIRDGDNWKKGMPIDEYVRSLIRHVMDFWLVMSGHGPMYDKKTADPQEIACAIMFNVQGFLHESMLNREASQEVDGFVEFYKQFMGKPITDDELEDLFGGLIRSEK